MARKLDIEKPTLEAIKKNAYIPDAGDMGKSADKDMDDLLAKAKSIGGDSGK